MNTGSTPYRWPLEAIWEEVLPRLSGFSLEAVPEIDSTNTELMRRARSGRSEPILLVAEHQSAGRGRLGRQWLGLDRGAMVKDGMPSLTFSLGLPLQCADWSGLSLAVGISLAQRLKSLCKPEHATELGLKWPNDVWWQGRKLAGILIETAAIAGVHATDGARYAVIGIGVNMQAPAVATLAMASGQMSLVEPVGFCEVAADVGAAQVLKQVVLPLIQTVKKFEKQGFDDLVSAFGKLDLLADKPVILSDGRSGIARGVDASGALQVDIRGERHSISSGEVSVRPLHNTVLTMNGHG